MNLKELLNQFRQQATTAVAKKAMGTLADEALDELEEVLLGKKGAADEILAEQENIDPLEELRKRHNKSSEDANQADEPTDNATRDSEEQHNAEDAEQKAREELARLKKAMGKEE